MLRRSVRCAGFGLLIGLALLLTGCLGDGDDVRGDEEVAAALLARATASVGEELELKSVTPFEWDRVVIPGSYWSTEEVNQLAGVDLPRSVGDAMKTTEDHSMLIFLRGGEVVSWTQFPRYFPRGVDLGDISRATYGPDAATFRVTEDRDGYVYLESSGAPSETRQPSDLVTGTPVVLPTPPAGRADVAGRIVTLVHGAGSGVSGLTLTDGAEVRLTHAAVIVAPEGDALVPVQSRHLRPGDHVEVWAAVTLYRKPPIHLADYVLVSAKG